MISGNIPDKTRVISMQIYNTWKPWNMAGAHGLAAILLVFHTVLLALYTVGDCAFAEQGVSGECAATRLPLADFALEADLRLPERG